MEPKKLKGPKGPEAIIQEAIIKKLTLLQWYVKSTHGNMFQQGFPDLYACHRSYGARWIEVKNPEAYCFTPAQLECFPMFSAKNIGIWVLVSDSDEEIRKLHGPANWAFYLNIMR